MPNGNKIPGDLDANLDDKIDKNHDRKTRKWYIVLFIIFVFAMLGVGTVLVFGGTHWPIGKHTAYTGPKLIVISIDGLRFDMVAYNTTPNLARMADEGIMSPLVPAYPSLTFPNHYSMMTGLLPNKHGIIGNRFADLSRGESFDTRLDNCTSDASWLVHGEPIWTTLEREGGRAGIVHWVGAGCRFGGKRAKYAFPFRRHTHPEFVTDALIKLASIRGPKQTPNLLMAYYSLVDSTGHRYGPESVQVQRALGIIDKEIGRLRLFLSQKYPDTNLMVVSDHGFMTVKERIRLEDIWAGYEDSTMKAVCSPVTFLYPKLGVDVSGIVKRLKRQIKRKHPGKIKVYTRESMPSEFDFTGLPGRIPKIILQAEPGIAIDCSANGDSANDSDSNMLPKGDHGYDPKDPHMWAIFIAQGPAFMRDTLSLSKRINTKIKYTKGLPHTVDVYRVMANCLDLTVKSSLDSKARLENICFTKPFL